MSSTPGSTTTYEFWGGPWDGRSIAVAVDDVVEDWLEATPEINGSIEGLYFLDDVENRYTWKVAW